MSRKSEWKKLAAQLLAAMAGGTIGAAVGGPVVGIPLAGAIALLVKVVDLLAGRKSRQAQVQDDLTRLQADTAYRDVGTLREMFLKASGLVPAYRDDLERLAEAVADPDGAKQDELLLEAITSLYKRTGATADPGEFAALLSAWPNHHIRPDTQTIIEPFCGRTEELAQLSKAAQGTRSVICVVGMAGEGKSALLGQWYVSTHNALKDKAFFWCRPYESGYSFARFLADILPYLTDGQYDPRLYRTTGEQAEYLCELLRARPTLVVLDGLERWLKRWEQDPDASAQDASADGRAGAEDGLDSLLRDAAGWIGGSALVFTTRALPAALEGRPVARIGRGQEFLEGLEDEAAVELLTKLGVQGEEEELLRAGKEYENHALTLTILGRLLGREYGGDVTQRPKVDPLKDDRNKRLAKLLGKVESHHRENMPLLHLVACCLCPAPVEMLAELLRKKEKKIRSVLANLDDWRLVRFAGKAADIHALVRGYVLGRLKAKNARTLQKRIATWLAGRPLPAQPQRLDEVQTLVLATQQALGAEDPDLATDFLYSLPAGAHHETLAGWLNSFGYLALSTELQARVVELYEQLVHAEGRRELRNDLAGAYNHR